VTSHLFDQGVGYIRVTDFSSDAGDKFAARLAELKNKGMRSLVIDLRNNPGGLLTSAQKIAEQFIKEGVLIHTKDRNNADDPVYIENGSTLNVPVTILVNENSASASEVLTGALRDYGIAIVVGMKSFGKGSVQQIVSLPSGGALKITVQEYLTPNMHKVNKVGLTPDIPADGEAAQMITALRTAGLKDIQLKADKHRLKINNVLVEDGFKTLREHGHVYVPSRAVAALLDGTITWDDKARAVQITAHGNSAAYPAGSEDLILQDGYSYVSLDAFTAKFPELHWTDANGKLVIDTEKGK
jgi:carboxyl-terminal processing protease